ncbi:MAG: 2-oxo-4-hydroxy-4-carboxy-5-ureidoimidazoline decarboxylase [Steroidobacteraceae bacterium]
MSLEQLNALSPESFVAALTGVFEHSDWVVERAAGQRPFSSVATLLAALRNALEAATDEEQLGIMRAHPDLRARSVQTLTPASASEQRRAGLEGCTPAEAGRLEALNLAYQERFGFPFILAVRGHDPASIIARCEQRLLREPATERATALEEIARIAEFRLRDRMS